MKRRFVKILAVLLVLCMLPAATAFAKSTVYDVYLCLSDTTSPAGAKTDSTVIDKYSLISGSERIAVLVVQAAANKYDEMYQFKSREMQRRMDESIEISNMTGNAAWQAWDAYGDKYNYDCPYEPDLIPLLADFDTTIEDVGLGTHVVTCIDDNPADSRYMVTYTLYIIIAEHTVGGIADPSETGVADWLNVSEHTPFMIGYPDDGFHPDGQITRAETAMIFYRLLKNKDISVTASFDDVEDGDWFAEAVRTLASIDIIKGVGGGKFAPDRAITRAEFAAIATRFAKVKSAKTDFVDVRESDWFAEAVSTAAAYGWIRGVGNNRFAPNQFIKRAEAAAIVNRMLHRLGDKEAIDGGMNRRFTDVTPAHWGWYDIAEATYKHNYVISSHIDVDYYEDWIEDGANRIS